MTSAEIALAEGWGWQATLSPLGSGRINDSYLAQGASPRSARERDAAATTSQSVVGPQSSQERNRWVLQRLNRLVFRRPDVLMENVARASVHLNAKRPGWTPKLIPTRNGASHVRLDNGVWRLWSYASGRSLNRLDNDHQAEAAGRALGQTHRWLRDLPGPRLDAAIPGHLQLDRCLANFDACEGAEPQLIDFIDARRHLATRFRERNATIHGDGHLDNLLFGEDGSVVTVLDLDTVMWGHWAWDFGDLARSALGGQALPTRFAAAARGYLDAAKVSARVDDLVTAPRYVTFMIGLRYLTDHLDGDRYFKVGARGENRQRALDRFRFLEALEAAEPAFIAGAEGLVEASGLQDGLNDDDHRDH